MDYTEESKKYVKQTKGSKYLKIGYTTFYNKYYKKNVENPLSNKEANAAIKCFFKHLYQKIIVEKYKFKLPVIGDFFYVAETTKPGNVQFISWAKSREQGKIVREANLALNGRKPYYKHERVEKVKNDKFYQLIPVQKSCSFMAGAGGLWEHIHKLLEDPTNPPYRANL